MKYLVIECEELGDQWECDANRIPVCVTDDYSKYDKIGYEVYLIAEDGTIGERIKEYDEDGRPVELIAYRYKDGAEEDYENNTDIEILETIKTKYTDTNIKTREKIARYPGFKKLVIKYLDLDNATLADYKRDFKNLGTCDEYDYTENDDTVVISLKQGNKITRNY